MTSLFLLLLATVLLMPILVGMLALASSRIFRDEDREHETGIGWWEAAMDVNEIRINYILYIVAHLFFWRPYSPLGNPRDRDGAIQKPPHQTAKTSDAIVSA